MDKKINIKSKNRKLVTICFLFFLTVSIIYAFYLYSRAATIDKVTDDLNIQTSENIDFKIEIDDSKKDLVKITGWAYIDGEIIKEALSKYVLWSAEDKSFYEVRTWNFDSREVVDTYNYTEETLEKFHYNYAGISAVVNKKQLKPHKGEYKIFIFLDNGNTKRFFDSGVSFSIEE